MGSGCRCGLTLDRVVRGRCRIPFFEAKVPVSGGIQCGKWTGYGSIVKYISYICSCPSGHYIPMKVFSLLSLDRNLVNFNKNEDKLITPITCRGALCYLHIAIIGVEYRLFVLGLTRASIQINEVLHTFLFIILSKEQDGPTFF